MKTSPTGIAMIEKHEALMLRAYDDARPKHVLVEGDRIVGTLTAGYGHTGDDVVIGMTVTRAIAAAWLAADLEKFEVGLTKLVRRMLEQNQFDALMDFTYNAGLGAVGKSTLLKTINADGTDEQVAAQFRRWTKGEVGGQPVVLQALVRRRDDEAKLWADHTHPVEVPHVRPVAVEPAPVVVAPTPLVEEHTKLSQSSTLWVHGIAGLGGAVATISAVLDKLAPNVSQLAQTAADNNLGWLIAATAMIVTATALFGFMHRALQITQDAKH
jgi:lysozyme